jgi:hypothetical protein
LRLLSPAAAPHDCTIFDIKPEHLDAWRSLEPDTLAALYAIFDDNRRPHYEHPPAA